LMMKPYPEQTYYNILDMPTGASPTDINNAYREALELYQDDSMAACSFFSDSERKEILTRLEEAYRTLINPESRSAYDRSLMEMGIMKEESRYHDPSKKVMPIYDILRKKIHYPWLSKIPVVDKSPVSENPSIQEILHKDRLAGQDLKRIRTTLGLTLAQIFQQTRIAIDILEAIEDDRFDHLPPTIYLKSFLKLYAECLNIDADTIVQTYIKHMKGEI
jgi:DnaJ-class molecular chaperone